MDSSKVFKKIGEGKEVYLWDNQENCMLKCFNDNGIVGVMLKRKGKAAFQVDVRNAEIYDIMQEAEETTKEVYERFNG